MPEPNKPKIPKFSSDPLLALFLEELMKYQAGETDKMPSPTEYAGLDEEAKGQRDKMIELQQRTKNPYPTPVHRPQEDVSWIGQILGIFRDDEKEADEVIGS